MRPLVNPLLAILTGLLLVALFPGVGVTMLAPVALAPLLVALARESSPLRRFFLGYASGIVFWAGVCHWIQFVLHRHGGLDLALSWVAFVLFCLFKGLHLGVFALAAGPLLRHWYALPAIAALWTGIERTHGTFAFAWLTLGNAGIDMGIPMRLAPLVGVYGLSFVFAMMAAAVALVLLRRPRRELVWLAVLPGLFLLPQLPDERPGVESASVLQPNISEDEAPIPSAPVYRRLIGASLTNALAAGQPKPSLIVWPEVPTGLYFDSDPEFRANIQRLATVTTTPVLFGTVAHTPAGAPLNSAQLISATGDPVDRYDKMYLVPFGEFVPRFFGFVNKVSTEAGTFAPGTRVVVFPVASHHVGAFICYESAFPHLVRRFAGAGADVFMNLSNDGYFGTTAARRQHVELVRMRAAENRRWIVRATNDGITAAIDPAGRAVEHFLPYVQLASRLRYNYESATTPYTRSGDWFAWGCLGASAALALLRLFLRTT